MRLALLRRSLVDSWRGLVGWLLGLSAIVGLYLPLYPSLGGNPEFVEIIKSMPPELISALEYDQITSGSGYTQGTVYGLLGFVLVTIAGVAWGAAAIAGDEERGTLELTLAHGVSRTRIVLERFAAIAIKLIVLVLWISVLVTVLNEPSELGLSVEGILAGGVALLGLGLVCSSTALLAGALSGRRVVAIGAGAGISVAGYALNALGNQSADLSWLHAMSPYDWAFGADPLANGFAGHIGFLYLLTVVAVIAATVGFRRRDVGA
jgi:ABC-2 type transport system permease protein